ncbi:hypothetical protein ACQPZJ_36570 [Actinoplanes sp. CA-054009]
MAYDNAKEISEGAAHGVRLEGPVPHGRADAQRVEPGDPVDVDQPAGRGGEEEALPTGEHPGLPVGEGGQDLGGCCGGEVFHGHPCCRKLLLLDNRSPERCQERPMSISPKRSPGGSDQAV